MSTSAALSAPIASSGTWPKRRPTARASSAGRHRQPRRAAGQRRGGAALGAVAVAVGLDHRAELGPVAAARRRSRAQLARTASKSIRATARSIG